MDGYDALARRQALARAGIDGDRIGRGAVILGPALSGKSTVLAAVRARARESGAQTCALQGALRDLRLVFDTDALPAAETDRPVVITVDDADLLGAPAAAEIFRRVAYTGARPVLACTTGTDTARPGLVDALWKDGHLPRIDLPDLGTEQIRQAAQHRLPAPVQRSEVEYLQRWSGGRAGVLTEVLHGLVERGERPGAHSVEALGALLAAGPRTRAAAADLDARLAGAVREPLQILAVCALGAERYGQGWVALPVAERICGRAALIEAERLGLIEASETAVRFTAPYHPAVLLAPVPVLARRRWRTRVVEELAEGGADDRSMMTIAVLGDAGTGDLLPAAARCALRAGWPDTAAQWADRAGDAGADIALWAGLHRCLTDPTAPLPTADAAPVWAPVLSALEDLRRLWQDDGARALLARLGDGDAAITAAAARLPVAERVRAAAADPDLMALADAWCGLIVGAAVLDDGRGAVAARVFDQARHAARADLLLTIRLRAAQVRATAVDGDLGAAAVQARRIHDDTAGLGAQAHRVAEVLQAQIRAQVAGIPILVSGPETMTVGGRCDTVAQEAWRQACDGKVAAAVHRLRCAAEQAAPTAAGSAAEWIELALRWSRPDPDAHWALRLATQILAVAPGPRHRTLNAYAQAWTLADGPALDRVGQRYAAVGRWGVSADIAAQAATVHRGRREAAASATAARRRWARTGAGPSPITRRWLTALADLTPRERQVVDLLATGATASAAARELGVSVRTVESHVFNACRKTGTTDRTTLVRAVTGT